MDNDQLARKMESLEVCQQDIAKKEREINQLSQAYRNALSDGGDDEERLESIRRSLARARRQLSDLIGVRDLLESELEGERAKNALTELYQTEGKSYQQAKTHCERAAKKLTSLGAEITINIKEFAKTVDALLEASEKAVSHFGSVFENLDERFCLDEFLQSGQLREQMITDHRRILKQEGRILQSYAFTLERTADLEAFEDLRNAVGRLDAWRRLLATFTPGDLMLTHKSLQPQPTKRRFGPDSETLRADRELKARLEGQRPLRSAA
ncbi:MAG: hypothetical protein JRI34_00930 [Deltaproteobacteria bacterium]|nr:hypothetical protein [Deltaproteobacteria bacterium]